MFRFEIHRVIIYNVYFKTHLESPSRQTMRKQALVKKHFTVLSIQPNQKMTKYACNHCKKKYALNVTRMVKHLKDDCRSCPQKIKDFLKSPAKHSQLNREGRHHHHHSSHSAETSRSENSFVDEDVEAAGSSKSTPLNRQKSKQPDSILKFCDTITKNEEKNLQSQLALAIFASGTPLSVTENVYWQEFFAAARPSLKLPSRYELSNPLLDNAHQEVKNDVEEKVASAPTVGIQCDGWSNARNEGIINFIVTTPNPVFFETISTEANSQTAEFIAKKMSEVIEKIGADKVLGVCTDNAAAMKRAWKILDDQYAAQKIVFYGCIAHILNLLIKDIAAQPAVVRLVKNATAIVREIKDGHVISALFAEVQKEGEAAIQTTLKLPVKTRFGYLIHCFESLQQNKHNLQALAILPKAQSYWKRDTKLVVLEEEFWGLLDNMLTLLRPIGTWISRLESDESKLSLVPEVFYELEEHFHREMEMSTLRSLPVAETEKVMSALKKRRDMALHPIHFAANILDPEYKGEHLADEESMAGNQLIFELAIKFELDDNQVLAELADYMVDQGVWSKNYVQRAISVTSAVNWWKGFCNKTFLSKISTAILNLPPTSAATERSFSTYGWIHSTKRNRLTVKRAGMLTYIAHNLALQGKKTHKRTLRAAPISDEDESNVESSEPEEDFVQYQDEARDGEHDEKMDIETKI